MEGLAKQNILHIEIKLIKSLHCFELSTGFKSVTSRTQFSTLELVLLSLQTLSTKFRKSIEGVARLRKMSRHVCVMGIQIY